MKQKKLCLDCKNPIFNKAKNSEYCKLCRENREKAYQKAYHKTDKWKAYKKAYYRRKGGKNDN